MPPNVTPGYLKYLAGTAEDTLNAAFPDEEQQTRAYRSRLRHVIEVYGGVREQLGNECADLVAELPCEGTFGLEDAQIAMAILRATAAELQDILEEDKEFVKTFTGERNTDDDADTQIRLDAAEFSKRHNIDRPKLNEYDKSARSLPDPINNDGTHDSFYGGNHREVERDIQKSARDEQRPPKVVTIKTVQAPPTDPPKTAAAPPTEAPTPTAAVPKPPTTDAPKPSAPIDQAPIKPPAPRPTEDLKITAEDYALKDPRQAFKMGMKWLGEHIALVAAGTREYGAFPRIAPLIALSSRFPEAAPTAQTVADLVGAMRHRFEKLRAPSGGDANDLMMRLKSVDPSDPHSAAEVLEELLGEMTGKKKGDGDWEKPWAEGGWQE